MADLRIRNESQLRLTDNYDGEAHVREAAAETDTQISQSLQFEVTDFPESATTSPLPTPKSKPVSQVLNAPRSKSDGRFTVRRSWGSTSVWGFEIIACVFSIACFITLIVVLAISNGKEPQTWLGGYITFNGLIALITTITRASIMVSVAASLSQLKWNHYVQDPGASKEHPLLDLGRFDSASRGPWGSIKFLTSPHIGLAFLGALITTCTLAFDFFAQQVSTVHYGAAPLTNGSLPGIIHRSEQYDRWEDNGISVSSMPDLSAHVAMMEAVMSPETIVSPRLQCPSGHCTWPDVSSLAVCGDCTDISDTVTFVCRTSPTNKPNCTYHVPEANYTYYQVMVNATWATYGNEALRLHELDLVFDQSKGLVYNETQVGYISKFIAVDSTYRTSSQISAHSCALWYCVQIYRTEVRGGVQTQTILANYSKIDADEETPGQWSRWTNATGFTSEQANVPIGTNFSWDKKVTLAYHQSPFFDSTTSFPSTAYPDYWFYKDDLDRYLIKVTDWASFIDRVAMSMTNNIRLTRTASTSSSRYEGQVWSDIPHVHIRWGWIAFPASLVLLSTGLLLGCIWDTERKRAPVWKDDALALLFCQVDPDIKNYFTDKKASLKETALLDTSDNVMVMRAIRAQVETEMTTMI